MIDALADGARAACAPGGPVPTAWLALAERVGSSPQVVLGSRADDRVMLEARGIVRLHPAAQPAAHRPRIRRPARGARPCTTTSH